MSAVATIAETELRLLLRNRVAAVLAIVMPVGFGAFLAFRTPDLGAETMAVLWVWIVTTQVVTMLGFTVYLTTTITFAARRQELYLKRLRSGQARDLAIIAGLAVPSLLVAVAQLVILLAMSRIGGMPWPQHWWPFVAALAGGALMCSAVAVCTSAWTRGAEAAQITTAPFFFLSLMGAVTVMRKDGEAPFEQVALPGGSIAELTRAAWLPGQLDIAELVAPLLLLAAWVLVPAVVAVRTFRWAPRE